MSRRRGFVTSYIQAQREAERRHRAELRAAAAAVRELEHAKKERERARVADERERRRLHLELRASEAAAKNESLRAELERLQSLLGEALGRDPWVDFENLKSIPKFPRFEPGRLGEEEPPPSPQDYVPARAHWILRLLPGARGRRLRKLREAGERYKHDAHAHQIREADRKTALAEYSSKRESVMARILEDTAKQHSEVDEFHQRFEAGSADAIRDYFTLVLEASSYPDDFPRRAQVAYQPESKQLIVEHDFPPLEVIPSELEFKFVKGRDEIVAIAQPEKERAALYRSVLCQMTLRTLDELFRADRLKFVSSVVFNGHVDTTDKATGRAARPCLVTVRATRDTFASLELAKVNPEACLKALNAAVSKSPTELLPVRPVLEFKMTDPRFIQEEDVLSQLDHRPNLMELTPSEFESLITNLFEKMGLETRLTQASRDGGVDCVAYDQRPIFGGKVVIQAKRYKHTVGVSAVRDLFGTVQNEGASKGILVTTSGFGQASFEFAAGKPLELLSGGELLYLLSQHAGVEAKIVPPEDWKDPEPDAGG